MRGGSSPRRCPKVAQLGVRFAAVHPGRPDRHHARARRCERRMLRQPRSRRRAHCVRGSAVGERPTSLAGVSPAPRRSDRRRRANGGQRSDAPSCRFVSDRPAEAGGGKEIDGGLRRCGPRGGHDARVDVRGESPGRGGLGDCVRFRSASQRSSWCAVNASRSSRSAGAAWGRRPSWVPLRSAPCMRLQCRRRNPASPLAPPRFFEPEGRSFESLPARQSLRVLVGARAGDPLCRASGSSPRFLDRFGDLHRIAADGSGRHSAAPCSVVRDRPRSHGTERRPRIAGGDLAPGLHLRVARILPGHDTAADGFAINPSDERPGPGYRPQRTRESPSGIPARLIRAKSASVVKIPTSWLRA